MDSEKSMSIAGRLLTPGFFFTDVHRVALIVERKTPSQLANIHILSFLPFRLIFHNHLMVSFSHTLKKKQAHQGTLMLILASLDSKASLEFMPDQLAEEMKLAAV